MESASRTAEFLSTLSVAALSKDGAPVALVAGWEDEDTPRDRRPDPPAALQAHPLRPVSAVASVEVDSVVVVAEASGEALVVESEASVEVEAVADSEVIEVGMEAAAASATSPMASGREHLLRAHPLVPVAEDDPVDSLVVMAAGHSTPMAADAVTTTVHPSPASA